MAKVSSGARDGRQHGSSDLAEKCAGRVPALPQTFTGRRNHLDGLLAHDVQRPPAGSARGLVGGRLPCLAPEWAEPSDDRSSGVGNADGTVLRGSAEPGLYGIADAEGSTLHYSAGLVPWGRKHRQGVSMRPVRNHAGSYPAEYSDGQHAAVHRAVAPLGRISWRDALKMSVRPSTCRCPFR